MKVSVIISAHKPSRFLDEAILSAKRQDFDDYEIILSSDGADLKWYADNYNIEYCQSEKKNHSHALNEAVKIACGEYIKDHHYDDIMLPNCLADLWDGRGASIIYANAINFWPNGLQKNIEVVDKITWDGFYPMLKSPIHAAAYIFKRSDFLELGGRDEDMDNSEEVEYFMRLLSLGYTFKYVNKYVAKYRRHMEQKTQGYFGEPRQMVINYLSKKYGAVRY